MAYHKILIVDDEIQVHGSFRFLFGNRPDMRLFFASGGREGLELLKAHKMDLVISDQVMPGVTGTEFLREVKKKYPETVRILMTGYSDINTVIDAVNSGGIYRYLPKPWNDDELVIIIEQALYLCSLQKKNRKMSHRIRSQNRALRESRNTFYSILKSIGEGVITSDFEGSITFINSVAETYCGYSSKEALGKNLFEVFYILSGRKRITFDSPSVRIRREGICIKHYKNHLLVNRKGVEIPVNFSISPVMDENDNMAGYGIVLVFYETGHGS